MKNISQQLLCLACLLAISTPIFSQQEKLSLALEFCPILNYTNGKTSDAANARMEKLNPNILLGLNFFYTLSENSKVNLSVRISGVQQKMYQTQFFGHLDPVSYTHAQQGFTKYAVGLGWNQRIAKKLFINLGGSIDIFSHVQTGGGYSIVGTPQYSYNFASLLSANYPSNFLPSFRQLSLNTGIYKEIKIGKKNKQALLGLRFTYPFGKMPQYETINTITTKDKQILVHDVTYNSRYYQTDLLLAYKIFRHFE